MVIKTIVSTDSRRHLNSKTVSSFPVYLNLNVLDQVHVRHSLKYWFFKCFTIVVMPGPQVQFPNWNIYRYAPSLLTNYINIILTNLIDY